MRERIRGGADQQRRRRDGQDASGDALRPTRDEWRKMTPERRREAFEERAKGLSPEQREKARERIQQRNKRRDVQRQRQIERGSTRPRNDAARRGVQTPRSQVPRAARQSDDRH